MNRFTDQGVPLELFVGQDGNDDEDGELVKRVRCKVSCSEKCRYLEEEWSGRIIEVPYAFLARPLTKQVLRMKNNVVLNIQGASEPAFCFV